MTPLWRSLDAKLMKNATFNNIEFTLQGISWGSRGHQIGGVVIFFHIKVQIFGAFDGNHNSKITSKLDSFEICVKFGWFLYLVISGDPISFFHEMVQCI